MIEQKQKEAQQLFEQLPMPKEKDEAWRHTRIDKFDIGKFLPFSSPQITLFPLAESEKKKGVIFCTMKGALKSHYELFSKYYLKNMPLADKFLALNAAMWQDGVFLYVPRKVHLAHAIKSTISATANAAIRSMIILEEGASASFLEEYHYSTEKEMMASCCSEVHAGANSKLTFHHLTKASDTTSVFTSIIAGVEKDAQVQWRWATFGGKLNRLKIDTLFDGQGSSSENIGIMIGRRRQHLDCTTNAYHNTTNTTNDMAINAIMMDNSSSIYRGLIKIRKEAQGTNSYLSNHVLKLSEKAVANSIPSLEIDANEVKASHGATIGQIDSEQLFYLQSRGLTQQESEKLIVGGFFEPLILKIHDSEFQQIFRVAVLEAAIP